MQVRHHAPSVTLATSVPTRAVPRCYVTRASSQPLAPMIAPNVPVMRCPTLSETPVRAVLLALPALTQREWILVLGNQLLV